VTLPSSLPACTRIFELGEQELVRRGVRSLLEEDRDLEVVGEATTAAEARVRISVLRPEVVILDVRLRTGARSSSAVSCVRPARGWPACC
jgi:DNA-binding NarL/FixJ family response regulator